MRHNHLGLFAAIALAAGITPGPNRFNPFARLGVTTTRTRRRVPTMVCSTPAEIAAWNAAVDKKKMARHVRRMNARIEERKRLDALALDHFVQTHRASAGVPA